MNQRIRELAEQAGKYARDYVAECKHYGYYMEHNEYDLRFEAKFAELIVRECISIIEGIEPGYKDYRDQIEDAFRRDCVEEIKHKFGVEE